VSLASGVVFQMDKTASSDQSFLWDIRECRKNTNMDCNISVCACRHSQETPQSESESVYNSTDFKRVSF
jgi:hypothetical protein